MSESLKIANEIRMKITMNPYNIAIRNFTLQNKFVVSRPFVNSVKLKQWNLNDKENVKVFSYDDGSTR
jgi:hypothetical protein